MSDPGAMQLKEVPVTFVTSDKRLHIISAHDTFDGQVAKQDVRAISSERFHVSTLNFDLKYIY